MKSRGHSVSGAAAGGTTGAGSSDGRLTPKQQEQQQRRQRALELHSEGKTLQEIADQLGWSSPSGVSYALKVARKELSEAGPVEDLLELRRIHYARLEELFSRVYPLALGGIRDGKRVPPDPKYVRLALRIMADENELLGLNVTPDEGIEQAPPNPSGGYVGREGRPVLVVDFDQQGYEAAKRRRAQPGRDELVAVDDQPPAGYIAPRPDDRGDEPEELDLAPNSVDPRTGQPVHDPRAELNGG